MKIFVSLLCMLIVLAGCNSSSKRETVTGQQIQRTVEEACVQAANDLNIPAGRLVVIGPVVSYDPRLNREVEVGISAKFGRALHAELARRGVTLVQGKDLNIILAQQKMSMSALFAERHRIGRLLKADYIIVGSVVSEDSIKAYATITIKCDNIEEGRTVTSSTFNLDKGPTSGLSTEGDFALLNVRCSDPNCRICGGTGVYDCPQCKGSGYLEAPRMCTACGGQGFSPCMQCMQTGQCQMCQGTGYVNGVVCTACSGGGGCPAGCEGGKLKCSVCQGKGELKKFCAYKAPNGDKCENGKIVHKVPKE